MNDLIHMTAASGISPLFRVRAASLAVLIFLAVGCQRESKPADKPPPQDKPEIQTKAEDAAAVEAFIGKRPEDATAALPPGHPPLDLPPSQSGGMPPENPPIEKGPPFTLTWNDPADWIKETPKNAMRKGQYRLPAAEGDDATAEALVFYFGPGQGGGTRANIDRWSKQFTGGDPAKEEKVKVSGFEVTLLDVAGKYTPAMTFGTQSQAPKGSYRMLGAVVETPGASWFFKVTGPAATISKHEKAFRAMIESVQQADSEAQPPPPKS
jgi:hypothetical protein